MTEQLTVRTYQSSDHKAVSRLYATGLLAGQLAANDTGADIENMHAAYFSDDANHFWVAEIDHHIVGMIGVARDEGHTAEIRRLRVDPDWQQHNEIAAKLLETALFHCKQHDYLKIVLDTRFEKSAALGFFDRFGFQHTRSKPHADKELLEFYVDLYRQPKQDGE